MLLAAAFTSALLLAAPPAGAAPARPSPPAQRLEPVKPGPREKCPVCGMFVAKYPDWIAGVRYRDGTRHLFDGAKDLFKFLLGLDGGGPPRSGVEAIFVTDYYAVTPVDARAAFFVVGSDAYGPMGRELVPFARLEDAREFLKDHRGERILTFDEVTPAVVKALD